MLNYYVLAGEPATKPGNLLSVRKPFADCKPKSNNASSSSTECKVRDAKVSSVEPQTDRREAVVFKKTEDTFEDIFPSKHRINANDIANILKGFTPDCTPDPPLNIEQYKPIFSPVDFKMDLKLPSFEDSFHFDDADVPEDFSFNEE